MCPHCGVDNSKVVATRRHDGEVFRKRKCYEPVCRMTFISREYSSPSMQFPQAILDAQRERFDQMRNGRKAQAQTNNEVFKVWG